MVGIALLSLVLNSEAGTIVAPGQASRILDADRPVISVSTTGVAKGAESAQAAALRVQSQAQKLAMSLRPAGKIDPYSRISLFPTFERAEVAGMGGGMAPEKISGYTAITGFEWSNFDAKATDELTKKLAALDGTTASLVRYEVKDPAAVRKAILREAFLDARTKALEAAEAAGRRLGTVELIETGKGATLTSQVESNGSYPGGPNYQVLPVRKVLAQASITVRFRLL